MVYFVGVNDIVHLLSITGIETFIKGLADYIEEDFRRWPEFEKIPRLASHSPDGVIELMPVSDGVSYSFKYVNGHPNNPKQGRQTVTAFGVLADVGTGYPEFWSEMTILTALRTAATSALAARYLAREDATSMAMIGLGAQSEFQALAFRALTGISRLQVFDIDRTAAEKFIRNLAGKGFDIRVAASAHEAVRGADIITTVTADKARAVILGDNMVGEGVHINAVGGDCPGKTELHPGILSRARVFVELPEQTRIEGEIQQMPADFPVTELWEVISGLTEGRQSVTDITIFDSVGYATEDFSALRYLRDLAMAHEHFTELDLIAAPDDPRDLFGLLAQGAGEAWDRRARRDDRAQLAGQFSG